MSGPEVKFCGLTRRQDAEAVAALGARYAGVVLAPGGRRSVTPAAAGDILGGLPLTRVGVFVDAGRDELLRAAELASLDVLQLHGDEGPELIEQLRAAGAPEVWKAVRPRTADEFVHALERFGSLVDALLLDGWSAQAAGGTGSQFPWEAVAPERPRVPARLRLVVAGGLGPHNVGRAISLLRPAVVDVSSGVESAPGVKDRHAIEAFLDAVRAAATPQTQSF